MGSWSFILTDKNHTPVGEILNVTDRKVAIPHSKLATASFTARLDNPLADALLSAEGFIKGYRDNTLRYHGPIISAEEVVEANRQTVAVNSVGAGWVLAKRLAGKSSTGHVVSSARDRALIVKDLIDAANVDGETGISTALHPISAASSVTYTAGPYRPISECINDLAISLDGFDWAIEPVENYVDGALVDEKIGSFHAEPIFGEYREEALFEYGGVRANLAGYKRAVSRDGQANKVYHLTSEGAASTTYPVRSAIDASSISDWGLLEDLAQADLLDSTMRQQLVDEHVRVRKVPRQVIEVTPHSALSGTARLPDFGVDYDVGDTVPARATYGGVVRFDAILRVWAVAFEIDALGAETVTLTLAQE